MDLIGGIAQWFADPAHWHGSSGIPARLGDHLALSGAALVIAAAVGLVVGVWVGHTGRGATLAVNLANFGRALPTFGVMGVVVPVTAAIDNQAGFKVWPAEIGLVVLAIPPILVNAYAGIAGVDREVVEAGRAAGMGGWQVLWRLEIPLAVPVILTGIRSGASQIVATATLAAVYAGPGLGRFIVEGLANLFAPGFGYPEMWAGVILVGATFAAVEVTLAAVQRALTSPGLRLVQAARRA